MVINLKYIYKNTCNSNFTELINNILQNDSVDGLFINVRNLQVNYNGQFIDLSDYLEKLGNIKKKVILNIIPINNTSTDIISIQRENRNYVNELYNITEKFKDINFWYTSKSTRILYFLEEFFKSNCCGYYISEDLNYVDTCFYIIPPEKYNKEIISVELGRDKYIYFIVDSKAELDTITKLIEEDFKDEINSLSIITCFGTI